MWRVISAAATRLSVFADRVLGNAGFYGSAQIIDQSARRDTMRLCELEILVAERNRLPRTSQKRGPITKAIYSIRREMLTK